MGFFDRYVVQGQQVTDVGTDLEPATDRKHAENAPKTPRQQTGDVSNALPPASPFSTSPIEPAPIQDAIPEASEVLPAETAAASSNTDSPALLSSPKSRETPCPYCSAVARRLVLHSEAEHDECKKEQSTAPKAEDKPIPGTVCDICGSMWTNHSESAYIGCREQIEQSKRRMTEHELEVIKQFDAVVSQMDDVEVNYVLIRNYFAIPNDKFNDEELRVKIDRYQKLYKIARIAESCLHVSRSIVVKGEDDSLKVPRTIKLTGEGKKIKSAPKEKTSKKEKQIAVWVNTLGMTQDAAENMWNDTYGLAVAKG